MTASKQTTDGVTYGNGTTDSLMTYTYNLAGALVEQQYPSGRVVKNVIDNNGDLSIVQSKKNQAAGFFNYAKNFTYNASGAVTSMQLGNGRWESTVFNSRLQPTQIALGQTQGATNLLKLDYSYGTTTNNGNVLTQTITVPSVGTNQGFAAVQAYSYDSLNRLKDATENVTPNGGSAVQSWKQTYTFDRYGNRRFDQPNTTFPTFETPNISNPQTDASNNRFTTGQGYAFDFAGNLITDATGRSFIYDAENKQTEVKNSQQQTIGQYFFDGDDKRVKKVVPSTGEVTIFVYDASGKLVAEYSTNVTPAQDAKVSYLTNDTLGSPRITTDQNGNVASRRDFMPYGEEVMAGMGGRGMAQGYGQADTVRQKFTGYERDTETDLSFAQARMLNSGLGRFTRPDRYSTAMVMAGGFDLRLFEVQPQNWNAYLYCRNNPLKYVDRDGQNPIVAVLVAAGIGAVVGAIAGGGIEIAKQKLWDGNENIDWNKVGGAAIQGGIFGAVAGATGGLSLGYQVAALAVANAAGGMTNRAISGDPARPTLDPSSIFIDTAAGATGAYLAPVGSSTYMSLTNVSRNAAAGEVDILMASSPVPGMLPTLTRPVVSTAIRNEIYHGYGQNLANARMRSVTKTGTTSILSFLFSFDIATPVQSAPSSPKKKKDDGLKVQSSCSSVKDEKGKVYQMCGPTIVY